MQQTLGTILPLLKEYDTIFLNAFVACFYLITLIWLIKLCLYKKFDLYDFLFVVLVYGGYYGMRLIAGESLHGYAFALALISDLYFLYAFNSLIRMNNIRLVFKTHALNHLKNAEYDYFATVDRKDAIKDISISLAAKLGLELKDIRKYKFWEVLTETAFNIVSVNDHLFIEDVKEEFKNEYLQENKLNVNYQFTLEVQNDDEEIDHYTILIKPIFYGRKYLGKTIFIDRNRWQILTELNDSLGKLMDDYSKAKAQNHLLLSLTTGVLLYYDYQTRSYVMTETFRKVLNTAKTEFTKAELLDLIHPDDVQKYVSLCGDVNRQEVTSIIFRLKVNNKYRKIVEEALFIDDQQTMVSVVKTLPIREENSDNVDYIKSVTTPSAATAKEIPASPGDDLKNLEEKMQKTDLDRLETLLKSAIKKGE
jgi:hypothetical protein